ncbi:hypothetical protein [Aurantiacibacter sp. MUD61]|uniref:hypothetical protein n=1 Tax=Aurantiacibacter sp. MUD61 TaxID=3009083 RepID=UPI0022F1008A|nr:hypothetical protein [Aurantiacibacter sp. MUD61]
MMQARFRLLRALPLAALPLVAACASPSDDYPSLALRDGELVTGTMLPAESEPYVPAPPAPATIESVNSLIGTVRDANAQFMDELPSVRRQIAAGRNASVGSDAWSNAQVALAGLQTRHNEGMIAMADLVRIYAEISAEGEAIEAVEGPYEEAAELLDQQHEIIAELIQAL